MSNQFPKEGAAETRRLRWIVAVVALTSPAIAFAYVDPGTGAYIVQSIMALIGAATFYAMRPIRFLRNLLSWRKQAEVAEPESQD
jgi:hypothetical protein